MIGRGGYDTVDALGRLCGGGGQGARRGAKHRAYDASALAPNIAHFPLTRRIRMRRRRKRAMTEAARRTAAAAEQRGGRIIEEVSKSLF